MAMNVRRRALALLLVAAPLAAAAQSQAKVARLGVLGNAPGPGALILIEELRKLGWVEGQNLVIERRYMRDRPELLPQLAADLVRLKPDVILAGASTQVEPLSKLTREIPIVFSSHGDPVGLGHVQSLARPGGNITGVSHLMSELNPKMLELLSQVVPEATRIGVLWNPTTPSHGPALRALKETASKHRLELRFVAAAAVEDFEPAFVAMTRERVGAALVVAAPITFTHRSRLGELGLKYRLPTVFLYKENAEAGGLMSYGPDSADSLRQSVRYIDRILRGAKPADLPVEQASKYDLVINLRTAKSLGLAIPQTLLIRADRVIE